MSSILAQLNDVQKQAVEQTEGPVLVLSGPGSGKTRVITYRIAYLIEKGVAPENILSVTFTNKAANEMKERIRALTEHTPAWMGTFHSICSKILRKSGYFIGISPSFVIYDEADSLDLIKDLFKDLGLNPKQVSANTVSYYISDAKNNLIDPQEYTRLAQGYFQEVVAKIYLRYQESLRKAQALDFDDLIMEAVRLFQENKGVLEKYQDQFQYILVDEYQDTNHAQYILTKLLAQKHHNICIVGDMSQSVYLFRGADFRNILNFERDFSEAKKFNLEQNYRSTKTIIRAATKVISRNRTHPVLDIWTKNEEGVPIVVYESRNEIEEAEFVIRMIKKLSVKYKFSDFVVLYRTNAQSRVLEEAMLREGLPYTLVGGVRFYERREIKDILAYLRLLVNKEDRVSLKRVVNVPPRGIGPAVLKDPNHPKITKFLETLEGLREKACLPARQGEGLSSLEIIDLVVKTVDYLEYLDDGTPEGGARVENVKELRSVASEFPLLTEFLENVALVEQEYFPDKANGERKDSVTLMTLHAAKGLEFSVVFMVGMEEGLFPHSRSLLDHQELEEERRLCYVGMTRAKDQLYFTYAQERLYFGSRSAGIISRFLADIPEESIIPIKF